MGPGFAIPDVALWFSDDAAVPSLPQEETLAAAVGRSPPDGSGCAQGRRLDDPIRWVDIAAFSPGGAFRTLDALVEVEPCSTRSIPGGARAWGTNVAHLTCSCSWPSPGDLQAVEIARDSDVEVRGRTADDLVSQVGEVRGGRPDMFTWIRDICLKA
jgi:hypothetical protein